MALRRQVSSSLHTNNPFLIPYMAIIPVTNPLASLTCPLLIAYLASSRYIRLHPSSTVISTHISSPSDVDSRMAASFPIHDLAAARSWPADPHNQDFSHSKRVNGAMPDEWVYLECDLATITRLNIKRISKIAKSHYLQILCGSTRRRATVDQKRQNAEGAAEGILNKCSVDWKGDIRIGLQRLLPIT